MELKFTGDYHTHTRYSDGKNTVFENVSHAREIGLRDIAITEHGARNIIMSRGKYVNCRKDVEACKQKYSDINVLMGIESDIIDENGQIDLPLSRFDEFDLHIVGFHFPVRLKSFKAFTDFWLPALRAKQTASSELIKRYTTSYIKMLQKYPIDILAHLGNHTPLDAGEVAKVCSDYGTYIELNAKHLGLCERYMEQMLATSVQFIANTDAHTADHVGDFNELEKIIIKYNIEDRVVNLKDNFYLRSKRANVR